MRVQHDWFYGQENWHTIISSKLMGQFFNSWIYAIVQNMQAIHVGVVCLVGMVLA